MSDMQTGVFVVIAATLIVLLLMVLVENSYLRRRMDRLTDIALCPPMMAGTRSWPAEAIARERDRIAGSFPQRFVSQFSPAEFNQLVEERLRTTLAHSDFVPKIGRVLPGSMGGEDMPEPNYSGANMGPE